jgi:hypothetical protein
MVLARPSAVAAAFRISWSEFPPEELLPPPQPASIVEPAVIAAPTPSNLSSERLLTESFNEDVSSIVSIVYSFQYEQI